MTETKQKFQCGYVGIIGRPNVGKSTLLNHILGQKLCITSRKPQTTRHNLLGVKTVEQAQFIYVDTPGLHQEQHSALNRYMNKNAMAIIPDVDVLLFLIDKDQWNEADEWVLQQLEQARCPVILVLNKVDQIEDKNTLLPFIEKMQAHKVFDHIVPISALKAMNIDHLEEQIQQYLPENNALFSEDQITDRSERFFAAEIVREKLMRMLGDELPYQTTVEIEQFKYEVNPKTQKEVAHIHALVWVERDQQKAIVIGKQGSKLKQIGSEARKDIEAFLQTKVMLNIWVKVKAGWSNDLRALRSLGYEEG